MNTLTILKDQLDNFNLKLSLLDHSLISNNFVVKCGMGTIGKDADGKVIVNTGTKVSLWDEKGVEEIMSKVEIKNLNKEVITLEPVDVRTYYSSKVTELQKAIDLISK